MVTQLLCSVLGNHQVCTTLANSRSSLDRLGQAFATSSTPHVQADKSEDAEWWKANTCETDGSLAAKTSGDACDDGIAMTIPFQQVTASYCQQRISRKRIELIFLDACPKRLIFEVREIFGHKSNRSLESL